MCQDFGDIRSGSLGRVPGGLRLPTYFTPVLLGELGKDLAVEVGHGESVTVGDDQGLAEGMVDVQLVEDLVDVDDACRVDLSDPGVGCRRPGRPADPRGAGVGAGRLLAARASCVRCRVGRVGLRSCLPCSQRGDASWESSMRSFGVVDLVEGVDLSLQLGQACGERLLVEVAEQV